MTDFVVSEHAHFLTDISVGAIPAAAGSIRLANAGDITVRNQNDNGDQNVISFDASANMILGDAGMPNMNLFASIFNMAGAVVITGARLSVGTTPALAGTIALPNLGDIQARNFANNGNLAVLSVDASDVLQIGAGVTTVNMAAALTLTGDITTTANVINLGDGGGDSKIQFSGCTSFFCAINASPEEMALGVGTSVTQAATEIGLSNNEINFRNNSLNGQSSVFKTKSVLGASMTSGSTLTFTNMIPAGSLVLAVSARVTTLITGPAGFDIGDGTTVDRWGNSILVALNTTTNLTDYVSDTITVFPSATSIILTSDGIDFTAGQVRLTIHYMLVTPATS